jgi:hypothetical protein
MLNPLKSQPEVTENSLFDTGRRQIRPAFPGTGTTVVKLAFAGKRRANLKRVRARVTDRQTGERKTTMDGWIVPGRHFGRRRRGPPVSLADTQS